MINTIFFFKQKTADEMRIRDWSSDVCSSDLRNRRQQLRDRGASRDHLLREPRLDPLLSRDHAARRPLDRRRDRKGDRRLQGRILVCGRQHLRRAKRIAARHPALRSEEHTSELQSLMRISYAVFCLKKKKRK